MKTLILATAILFPLFAQAIVPINGGMAPGTTVVVNNGPGDQTDPHVSGSIAVYTDLNPGSGVVRYFNFATGVDLPIPNPILGAADTLPGVSGNRISFSRQTGDRNALMVFDLSLGTVTEIAPQAGSRRFSTSIGGNTVAVVDQALGGGGILVADITAPLAPAIILTGTPSSDTNGNPSVAPAGNAVVWERCNVTFTNCSVLKSIFSGGAWGAAQVVSAGMGELNGRTDGNVVVYDSDRILPTTRNLYWQALAGGAETRLELAGEQSAASISQGVIAFQHRTTSITPTDIFIYVIATNTIYQVTDTPRVDEVLTGVTVLPSGEVRVVWAANADFDGRDSVFAKTFRVPLGPPPYLQVSAGSTHTCAVRSGGSVECWGSNSKAQAPATRMPAAPRSYTAVSAAAVHSCALTDAGVAECWGNNSFGQAPSSRAARSGNFTQLTSAGLHNCALRNDGSVDCWGWNGLGQAPERRVATLGKFIQLAAGAGHTCGLRDDGVVECWGSDAVGQAPRVRSPLSAGTYVAVTAGSVHTCATRRSAIPGNDGVECWGANGYGQAPVMLPGRFADVSAGGAHTCGNLIAPHGTAPALLGCWGNNHAGQAPPTRTPTPGGGSSFIGLGAGWAHTCAINQGLFVECWGDNSFGQAPAQRR